MIENPSSEVPIKFENVVAQATNIAQDTISYYSADKEYAVTEELSEGNRFVYIEYLLADNGPRLFQGFEFAPDGKLKRASVIGTQTTITIRSNQMMFSTNDSLTGLRRGLLIDGLISRESSMLRERLPLADNQLLVVESAPVQLGSTVGFASERVNLNEALPLSHEDVAKLMPEGRFVSFDGLLLSTIDPTRHGQEVTPLLENLQNLEFSETDDGDRVFGGFDETFSALPVKGDKNTWMVFTVFQGRQARVFEITLDFEKSLVTNSGGNQGIEFYYLMDGQEYSSSIVTPIRSSSFRSINVVNFARPMIAKILSDFQSSNNFSL